jgi:CheY-like chemotaxis protein
VWEGATSAMAKKILLVDDSATTRLLCRSIVARNTAYAIVCAQDGEQALMMAGSEKPDLILMDVMMPGMTGLEVCERLRREGATSAVPIVLLTFRTADESVQEGFASGCTAYLKKPVQETELLNLLHSYLD